MEMEHMRHFCFPKPQGQKSLVSYLQDAYRNPENFQNRVGSVDMMGLSYRPGRGLEEEGAVPEAVPESLQ